MHWILIKGCTTVEGIELLQTLVGKWERNPKIKGCQNLWITKYSAKEWIKSKFDVIRIAKAISGERSKYISNLEINNKTGFRD